MKFSDLFMWAQCLSAVITFIDSEGILQGAASRSSKEGEWDWQWEPIVCECDMKTHSSPISHEFSSADICWHFVASYLFKHL